MEMYERKYTTTFALKEMEKLFTTINEKLTDDINNFDGKFTFFCRIEQDNNLYKNDFNYRSWHITVGKVVYRDGKFAIKVRGTDEYYENSEVLYPTSFGKIEKIEFDKLIDALNDVIALYNEKAKEKDVSIENFIKTVEKYIGDA